MKLRYIAVAVVVSAVTSITYVNQTISALSSTEPKLGCAGYPDGRCESGPFSSPNKDSKNDLPDPDRNYFDGQGNMYDYRGNLISSVQPATNDGFRGK
jgi:hypothetical protein